jgi:hypothetical protein
MRYLSAGTTKLLVWRCELEGGGRGTSSVMGNHPHIREGAPVLRFNSVDCLMCFPQCPVELVMVASLIHPELLYLRDACGNTPLLHLAVAAKFDVLTIFLSQQKGPAAAGMSNDKGETPFCIARKTYEKWSKASPWLSSWGKPFFDWISRTQA